ncbi:MAG: xylulokinase [Lachnospiraceae bacterium]
MSSKKYVMGIDIGTSACKVAVFDSYGQVAANATGEYPVFYPKPGYAEQNPEDWWEAACGAIRKMLAASGIAPGSIAGIGIDGQSWSAIPIDRNGKVLLNTPIWMDTRAASICERLNKEIGEDAIFEVSGNPLQPSYSTAKILWYQENYPELYKDIAYVLQSNSFIGYRLTGTVSQDVSQGYGLHCFNMRTGTWDERMGKALGIPRHFLPDIYPSSQVIGTVTAEAAAQSGLMQGTPVVAGGLDAACGTLGAGVIHDGETQEQGGQAGGMSICTTTYLADPKLILSAHVVPNAWLLQGGTTGGGGVMRWLEQQLGDFERAEGKRLNKSSLELFNELAAAVPPGSDGMVFLPYMAGERSPLWDPNAKGVYYGLDFRKTKGHFIRSAMEGVAFSLQHNLKTAEKAGANVSVLRAMGGAANSLLWTQIKADVTGRKIVVPASDTATTWGAAILAGVGVGLFRDFEEAVDQSIAIKREHLPQAENRAVYDRNYEVYKTLYEQLKDVMKETGGMQE